MYLQQRIGGFHLPHHQSMEVLSQNKGTINALLECLNHNYMQENAPFRLEGRKIVIGEWVDVKDVAGKWAEGQILNIYNQYLLVHFNGWPDRMN